MLGYTILILFCRKCCSEFISERILKIDQFFAKLSTRVGCLAFLAHSVDRFYDVIMTCLRKACELCIPHKRNITNQFNVTGWNTFVTEKHDDAKKAYLFWLEMVNPVLVGCPGTHSFQLYAEVSFSVPI